MIKKKLEINLQYYTNLLKIKHRWYFFSIITGRFIEIYNPNMRFTEGVHCAAFLNVINELI